MKKNKFSSHTWLPYLTPNGVTHLTMLVIDIKILQNRAEKYYRFWTPYAMHSSYFFKSKCRLQKTYFLPFILVFTLVNSELKNFSSDRVTAFLLIINELCGHWSLVTCTFTLSLLQICPCLWFELLRDGGVFEVWEVQHGLMCLSLIGGLIKWVTPLGRVFKIRKKFPHHFMSNKWHFTRQPHPVRGDIR